MTRVWVLWTDRSEILEGATSVRDAMRRGLVSGLGAHPRYIGLHEAPSRFPTIRTGTQPALGD